MSFLQGNYLKIYKCCYKLLYCNYSNLCIYCRIKIKQKLLNLVYGMHCLFNLNIFFSICSTIASDQF